MKTYQVRARLEIVESLERELSGLRKTNDGSFVMTISQGDAMSIDQCERAVLETSYPAVREVIVSHFSEMSRKSALEMDIEGELIVNVQPYKVHGEVGRFDFTTHRIVNGDEVLFDTSCDLFPNLRSNEFYRTIGFKELAKKAEKHRVSKKAKKKALKR